MQHQVSVHTTCLVEVHVVHLLRPAPPRRQCTHGCSLVRAQAGSRLYVLCTGSDSEPRAGIVAVRSGIEGCAELLCSSSCEITCSIVFVTMIEPSCYSCWRLLLCFFCASVCKVGNSQACCLLLLHARGMQPRKPALTESCHNGVDALPENQQNGFCCCSGVLCQTWSSWAGQHLQL